MLRRRVAHPPLLRSAAALSGGWTCRCLSADAGAGSSNGSSGSGVRLHRFVRDNTPAARQSSPQQGGGYGSQQGRGPRGGGRGGYEQRNSSSNQNGGGGGGAEDGSSASSSALSWSQRLQMELLRETDPMGGMAHKDVYRDPSLGYSPQYAPRDFVSSGGAVAYHHPGVLSPRDDGKDYEAGMSLYGDPEGAQHARHAAEHRRYSQHDTERWAADAQAHRETMRQLHTATERETYLAKLSDAAAASSSGATPRLETSSLHPVDILRSETLGHRCAQLQILSRHSAPSPSGRLHKAGQEGGTQLPLHSPFSAAEVMDELSNQNQLYEDETIAEGLHMARGGRERERFDFGFLQRSSRLPFQGYDHDRWKAQREGKTFGALRLPSLIPPSSLTEAHKNLRESTGIPNETAAAQQVFLENTTVAEPQLGEGLTEAALDAAAAKRLEAETSRRRAREERFGLGRRGAPLVQDGGPDQRSWRRGSNDERMVDAMIYGENAYRKTAYDEHVNPYRRGDTTNGVGHLINSAFDLQRREDRLAHGKRDLTEGHMQHFGVPILQQQDEFVLVHRNARGERPLDYFRPFPHFRAQRLYQVYDDTTGFPLMRQRPEFLEWELFTRYRAHYEQRRALALRHGLEPVANETAQERDARRLKLDILCEQTPFDASKMVLQDEEQAVSVEQLRSWFGVFLLPSPTMTAAVLSGAATQPEVLHRLDELQTPDTREHLLSMRYLNRLSLMDGYRQRLMRGYIEEVSNKAPEPVIRYAQPESVLQHFSHEELAMYQEYVKGETAKQMKEWSKIREKRRFIPTRGAYGTLKQEGHPVEVVDVQHMESGRVMLVATTMPELASVLKGEQGKTGKKEEKAPVVRIDGDAYQILLDTRRTVIPLVIQMERTGEEFKTTSESWSNLPLEVPAQAKYNHALDFGVGPYAYNRGNYVETQDVLWEQRTAAGQEGWSPATHADGLSEGLGIRARRRPVVVVVGPVAAQGGDEQNGNRRTGEAPAPETAAAMDVGSLSLTGEWERGWIVSYKKQPFLNPNPRLVSIQFASDGRIEDVPLAHVQIWQRRYHGPERTVGNATRRYNPAGLRRYINVADPNGERDRPDPTKPPHFLEKYATHSAEKAAAAYRSTKQIQELDTWVKYDTRRADNHRPLSISHRRDYVRMGYLHKYTPWEWIAIQDGDQPLLHDTIREDNTGPSFFFSLRRFWRWKARPHGYLRHYDNEIRDMLQFVDGVTPWEKAKKIRTYWEVRQHHPMPQFNRPEVAMHRNTAALLPSHMWTADKKTGKVKGVKDSVRDYRTTTPIPKWAEL